MALALVLFGLAVLGALASIGFFVGLAERRGGANAVKLVQALGAAEAGLTLARELNVSRAPLREALWLLSRQGLVQIRAHHGAHVTQLSEQDIREIFEIRELLETHAAKKIRATVSDGAVRSVLRSALADLEFACRQRDIRLFSAADLRFHQTLWELGGNRHLQEILNDVSTRFFGYELIRDLPHS